MVMPEHLTQCHPFVGRSYFSYTRQDEEEGEDLNLCNETNVTSSGEFEGSRNNADENGVFDPPRSFLIDDSPNTANSSWIAMKIIKIATKL